MGINIQIKTDLGVIDRLIANSTYYFENLELISTSFTEDRNEVFNSFPFLCKMRISLWSLIILDIHKLLSSSENDRYRLISIINRIQNNYRNIKWEHKLSKEDIEILKSRIINEQVNIEKIKEIRDTRIAHFDNKYSKTIVKFEELKRLILLCQNTSNDLNLALFDSTTSWRFSKAETILPVVDNLTRFKNLRELGFNNLKECSKTIQTDEFIKTMRASS